MLSYELTADDLEKKNPEMAIIPIGSIEQHGPHLPLGTDWMIASAYSKGVAEATGAYLLPALPISTCREHMGKKGSVWMDPDAFYYMLKSILMCLKEQGFKKVVTLQCHGGIFIMPVIIREVNAKNHPDFMVVNIDGMTLPPYRSASEKNPPGQQEIHAGHGETSLMLDIAPELVKMDLAKASWPTVPRPYLGYGSIFRASPIGVWGDPTSASAEEGRKMMEHKIKVTVEEINRAFTYMESKEKFGYSYF